MLCLILYLVSVPKVTQAQITSLRPYERLRAIIVGVSDYANDKNPDLDFADDDAEYFSQMLREQTEWPVAPEDIVLLTNQDATYGRFIAELDNLTESVSRGDRVIIFFAGHGDVEFASDIPTGYLLFHDAPARTYAAGGACEVRTLDKAINKLIQEKEAQVILIADACRSGSLAGGRPGATATASVLESLFGNTVKILSCEPDQLSLEAGRSQHQQRPLRQPAGTGALPARPGNGGVRRAPDPLHQWKDIPENVPSPPRQANFHPLGYRTGERTGTEFGPDQEIPGFQYDG
jgi:hypothetical protein